MEEHKQYTPKLDRGPYGTAKYGGESDFVSTGNILRTDKNLVLKDFFIANDQEVQMLKGQKFKRLGIRSSTGESVFSIAFTDFLVGVTSLVDAPTIGLPRPKLAGAGKYYIIKDEVGGAATTTITIQSVGEETIDGSSTSTLTTNYQAKRFYSDGANWFTC